LDTGSRGPGARGGRIVGGDDNSVTTKIRNVTGNRWVLPPLIVGVLIVVGALDSGGGTCAPGA
jgi:hypothetical protein